MTNKMELIWLTLSVLTFTACSKVSCDDLQIGKLVNKDIISDLRRPEEYKPAVIKNKRDMIYVSIPLKAADNYFRHYQISRRTCEIVEVKIDQ